MKAAHEWWVQNRDEAPDLLRNEIARVTAALTEAPSIGRPVVEARQSGVRCFPMRRVRYELYYRISDEEAPSRRSKWERPLNTRPSARPSCGADSGPLRAAARGLGDHSGGRAPVLHADFDWRGAVRSYRP
ncbi:MAG: hypothetical protein IPG45_16125 [Deltaproteobacteria bacterium]|nr:hypothetical protein [Deltaproteobacteria bacterium]